MSGYERGNRNVLRRCLKTESDVDVQMAAQPITLALETEKVRLPAVVRQIRTTVRLEEADLILSDMAGELGTLLNEI